MNFYSFDDINAQSACLRYVREVLKWEMQNGRIQAKWRGGDGFNVAVDDHGWYDHRTKEHGGLIDLCALARFGARDIAAKQRAQDELGRWLGLKPAIVPERIKYDYTTQSIRFAELVREGYAEARKYVYTDRRGIPAHFTVRMEHPTKGKRFFQCTPWSSSLKGAKLYLYNLPAVLASSWAIVVEGEKDADTLIAMRLPATTCNCGADNWRDDYTESLRGKDVVICRDNDDAGNDHAHLLLRSLANAAKTLRVICPSRLPKGDVTDWIDREGGSREKLLAMIKDAEIITPDEAAWSDEQLALYRAKRANATAFANFSVEIRVVRGNERRVEVPRPILDMVRDIHVRFLGFPRRLGKSTLFDHDRDSGNIEFITSSASLIAWIGEKSRHLVEWKSGNGLATKEELFCSLMRNALAYEKVSEVPNYPRRPDVYYACKFRSLSSDTAVLDKFLSFFNPADEASAVLLRTLVASVMYYRPGVQRPAWIIDSRDGQAAGKTTVAELVSYLYRCAPIKTSVQELTRDAKELNKRLVSVTGRNSLMLLVDNVRGTFESAYFSDLVTGFSISGKAPYGLGEESRPNDLTYVITSNSANVGSDIASRSFIIYIAKPRVQDGAWKRRVLDYVDGHREEILSGVYSILAGPSAPDRFSARTRVPEFEREVLWKMAGSQAAYERVIDSVLASRDAVNVDAENAVLVAETIRDIISDTISTRRPDDHACFLRSNLVNKYLRKLLGIDIQDVRNMVNTGKIDCIRPDVRRYPRSSTSAMRTSGILFVGRTVSTYETVRVRILGLDRNGDAIEVTGESGGIEDFALTDEIRAERAAAAQSAANAGAIDVESADVRPPALAAAASAPETETTGEF